MKVAVFGGTTEGRRLAGLLLNSNIDVILCVATEYGKSIATQNAGLKILAKRMEQVEMKAWVKEGNFNYVIDATHPYAGIATKNIKAACTETNTEYLRLIRGGSEGKYPVTYVSNMLEAASYLNNTTGNILITTGSKELEAFTSIENYSSRMFVRIIPMLDSLQKAVGLGFKNSNIICMQGPFDVEMNTAILKMAHAEYMVTKDSGKAGGFTEKLEAAEKVGCKVIVVARPDIETGYTFSQILKIFNIGNTETCTQFTYFPLFINMNRRKVIVVGGGKIAERRIKKLLTFSADITAVSPHITDSIYRLAQSGIIKYINREYVKADISEAFLVIAATNNREVNHSVTEHAKKSGILAIASDNREECSCYFPAVADNSEYIAGIVSKNGNHAGVKQMAQELRWFLNNE